MAASRLCLLTLLALTCALFHSGDAKVIKSREGPQGKVPIGGREYFFGQFDIVLRSKALQNCLDKGMVLASFETKEENDLVMAWIKNNPDNDFWMWTSGVRAADSPNWMWDSTGDEFSDVSWREGEPSNALEEASCMNFSATAGGWEDDLCDIRMSYICEQVDVEVTTMSAN